MSAAPSAVIFHGKIYVFHQGGGNNGELWYNVYDGGRWWGDSKVPDVGMSDSPTATYIPYNDTIEVLHQGGGDNDGLWGNAFNGSR